MNNQSLYGYLYVCRNCKHYKIPERYRSKKYYCSRKALVKVMPSDFCSYFEMKEGEAETWNGFHGQLEVPKGTFDKIWNDEEGEEE